jgi:hypothetical protein
MGFLFLHRSGGRLAAVSGQAVKTRKAHIVPIFRGGGFYLRQPWGGVRLG